MNKKIENKIAQLELKDTLSNVTRVNSSNNNSNIIREC